MLQLAHLCIGSDYVGTRQGIDRGHTRALFDRSSVSTLLSLAKSGGNVLLAHDPLVRQKHTKLGCHDAQAFICLTANAARTLA